MDLERLRNPRGVSSTRDIVRLVLLVALAAIVVGAYFVFRHQAQMQREESPIDSDSYVEVPPPVRVPGATVDPKMLLDVRDKDIADRVIKEKEPYIYLIRQASRLVYGDMELLGVRPANAQMIRDDPAAYRGIPFEVKGNLNFVESITEDDLNVYRGYLTTPEGDVYYFTVLHLPHEAALGEVMKLQGFFFKIYSFEPKDKEGRINDAIFLVGKQLVPSFYKMEPVHALDKKVLDTVFDYDILDMAKPFDEKPLYHMLSYVQNLTPEQKAAIKYKEVLPPDILKAPGKYRGEAVQVLGEMVVPPMERELGPEGENPLGIKRLYHGILLNYRGGKFGFCYILSLDRPDWLQKKDLVYVKGYFFRNYAYRTQNENLQPAPVIIAVDFEKFLLPKDNTMAYISIGVLAVTILFSGFLLFHFLRDRKVTRQEREKFIARKKKLVDSIMREREKAGEKKPQPQQQGPANPPDPPRPEESDRSPPAV